jgi:hypothetical protein
MAASEYRVARMGRDDEELKAALSRQTMAVESMFQATAELLLIASHPVAGNALAIQRTLVEFTKASYRGQPFTGPELHAVTSALDALIQSMRDDLGEPSGTAEDEGLENA